MEIEYEYSMTLGELLTDFEQRYASVEKLRAKVKGTKKVTKQFADLEQWEYYLANIHKHKLTEEIRFKTAVIFHDSRDFFKYITPERVRLLDELRSGKKFESLNELAKSLDRDPKNVYEDVKALESKGLVKVDRRNRRRSAPSSSVRRVVVTI